MSSAVLNEIILQNKTNKLNTKSVVAKNDGQLPFTELFIPIEGKTINQYKLQCDCKTYDFLMMLIIQMWYYITTIKGR